MMNLNELFVDEAFDISDISATFCMIDQRHYTFHNLDFYEFMILCGNMFERGYTVVADRKERVKDAEAKLGLDKAGQGDNEPLAVEGKTVRQEERMDRSDSNGEP